MQDSNIACNSHKKFASLTLSRPVGRVTAVKSGSISVRGVQANAQIGDRVVIRKKSGGFLPGEIIQMAMGTVVVLPDGPMDGVGLDDRVILTGPIKILPTSEWLGRIIDPDGNPLDDMPLPQGTLARPLLASPPSPTMRKGLGPRLETGMPLFNTVLPIARGQRIGLFAGSGVGKSSLLGKFATRIESDVVVVAFIGERGREVRHFVEDVLGREGMSRAVIVAATSDQSALSRRRCAWTAMAVAEHFRDQGASVLLLADSVTRFAEAHREIAVSAGEAPVLRGHPPSTTHLIMSLCERAGPGTHSQGEITAAFSVLVAGSDMDEPIADILRGVLDGHVVLDREIAERGRFPAVDILKSVSRSLPDCATAAENQKIAAVKRYLSVYEKNKLMITAGLYIKGSDPEIDLAILIWNELEKFSSKENSVSVARSFDDLKILFRRNGADLLSASS